MTKKLLFPILTLLLFACQPRLSVEGKFEGNLHVTELLNVRETASISGEVATNKLIVQSGATFNVSCSMGGKPVNRPVHTVANNSHSQNKGKEEPKVVKEAKTAGAQ